MIPFTSWLGALNFIVLQWFFVRLARTLEDGKHIGWVLVFVWPLSGWWGPFKHIGGEARR